MTTGDIDPRSIVTIEEAAAWLDQERPGWWRYVDLEWLDQNFTER